MSKRLLVILGAIVVLFVALVLVVNYKNNEKIEKTDNPYGKSNLAQETIDQLDDPLYQNQIIPTDLDKKLKEEKDMLVYFYQPSCSHCKVVTPIVVPMTEKMDLDMKKVNLQEFNQDSYWKRYFIEGTPTVVQYRNGVEEDRLAGEHKKADYEQFFKEYKDYLDKK